MTYSCSKCSECSLHRTQCDSLCLFFSGRRVTLGAENLANLFAFPKTKKCLLSMHSSPFTKYMYFVYVQKRCTSRVWIASIAFFCCTLRFKSETQSTSYCLATEERFEYRVWLPIILCSHKSATAHTDIQSALDAYACRNVSDVGILLENILLSQSAFQSLYCFRRRWIVKKSKRRRLTERFHFRLDEHFSPFRFASDLRWPLRDDLMISEAKRKDIERNCPQLHAGFVLLELTNGETKGNYCRKKTQRNQLAAFFFYEKTLYRRRCPIL